MAPAATVVIPALNAADTIGEQLESLAGQDIIGELEIFVLDNGSTDATRDVVEAWSSRIEDLRLVDASARRGASNARNLGIDLATSEHVLFCDADDQLAPGWASTLLEALSTADSVAGRVVPWAQRPEVLPDEGRQELTERRYDFLPAFTTNNAAVRKSAVTPIGGFDERMDPAEDIDLSWRIQLAGGSIAFAPDAVVFARPRDTPRSVFRQAYAYGQSEVRLYGKFGKDGMPQRSWSTGVRKLGSLVRTAPALADDEGRMHWFGRAGWRCGRLTGSVRERVLYL